MYQSKFCGSCGTLNSFESKYCKECGKPMQRTCQYCAEVVESDAKMCDKCHRIFDNYPRAFRLTVHETKSDYEILQPSIIDFENAVKILVNDDDSFVILDNTSIIKDIKYIQATGYKEDKTVWVEIQLSIPDEDDKPNYKLENYGKRMSIYSFKLLVAQYWNYEKLQLNDKWKVVWNNKLKSSSRFIG